MKDTDKEISDIKREKEEVRKINLLIALILFFLLLLVMVILFM